MSPGSFLVGAGIAGVVTKHTGQRHLILVSRALATEVALLGIAAILAAAVAVAPRAASSYIVIAPMSLAMGVRTVTIARFGGVELTLVMLTGTLASLAAELPFYRRGQHGLGAQGPRSARAAF